MQNPIDLEARYCAQYCRPLPVIPALGGACFIGEISEAPVKAGLARLTA